MTEHNPTTTSKQTFAALGQRVIDIETDAVRGLSRFLDENFATACELLLACQGRAIVIGMGKSGHIGGKIAATLASTGTPAFFVHPGEASHGDLGMITEQDVVIAISNSGETAEVLSIAPLIKRRGVKLISMTGNPRSTLAELSDVHVCIAVEQEACPLGLAPTSSTTATLVMGDALAVALLHARGFTADDFAMSHPGGSLGRRLLLHIHDVMHAGERTPLVNQHVTISAALLEMSRKGLGMTGITDDQGRLVGIFTDGDLRRILDQRIDLHTTAIAQVMTPNPITIKPDVLAAQGLKLMEDRKINGLFVVDEQGFAQGALNMHDLLKAGVL
ncbi:MULTISPECIES: KpsF/GutQ family sugar-phosphate isomerase [Idiomarinaceae]|uniref:Arabinose 5-phosphate isomerase n=3 Tax=Pseudidiomarina TaxID=2800384 RepID=A0A368UTJ4_9GAMM|nr:MULTISPECIES: KpsF/GutQ family sugar-phosphate isomerase [Idiomarinaceae]MDT7525906.1 KpsF/GutQ family sugar-phosphate isomerase [Pseudidiomarina sp. GXY010]MDX1525789.1 KpsF/GutQ family sugar-phosphate isomerase [Pseudidiomarina maritima]MRJ42010.1 KpsF/GutQ family sugar-phosphate isomerase [Idiomarina sp. FeN1]NCU57293.1 KpsF/GutQ family sugar-phosphate isomerase [Idiomarina sp. FenA--70]NCU60001.1 KpsF/GutQ family sugar-phosphate isomerase [Idiomarina sp. FenBw--71]